MLGYKHPDEIDITPQQLGEWLWFYKTHGFGDDRADDRAFAVLASFAGGAKLSDTRWPYFDKQDVAPQIQTLEQLLELRDKLHGRQSEYEP